MRYWGAACLQVVTEAYTAGVAQLWGQIRWFSGVDVDQEGMGGGGRRRLAGGGCWICKDIWYQKPTPIPSGWGTSSWVQAAAEG